MGSSAVGSSAGGSSAGGSSAVGSSAVGSPAIYRGLAADYHWFFDDVALKLGSDVPGVRAAIAALPTGARVLDAACGIGVDAVALRARGLDVVAADASPEMVTIARQRVDDAGLDVSVLCCRWTELPDRLEPGSFDSVFCLGGSIGHAGSDELVEVLRAFRTLLTHTGRLVLDSHDWELVVERGATTIVEPIVVERDGRQAVRSYTWRLGAGVRGPHVFEANLFVIDGSSVEHRSYPIPVQGVARTELQDRVREAGFVSIASDHIPGDDRYTVVAERGPG